MKRSFLASSLAASFLLGLVAPLLAAETPNVATPNPAEKCLDDLRAFDNQMQQDGYWLGGYGGGDIGLDGGYGYGYPLGGFGYEPGVGSDSAETGAGYLSARPGYEIRTLLASADILARHGLLQPCEDVLAATRDHYKQYVADMERSGMRMANVPGWQRQQIAAAQPVTSATATYRSDQLLGTDVRNPQNQALGSIDDLVTNPQTGEITYLVIARGGWLFGIGEKYVAVPWQNFKIAPNATVLVLDATKSAMDAAPQANIDDLTTPGAQSQKVDMYWKALTSNKSNH